MRAHNQIAWLRIVFAEGPRQVINAVTLYTVMEAKLVPVGQHAATGSNSPVGQFFVNIQILAASNREQAAILFGMLFTLIIWLFSALGLILATIFYILFLWRHIPSSDSTLARYCRRKVDKRLAQIVGVNINKAIQRENKHRMKEEAKSDGKSLRHQPTLPDIGDDTSRPCGLSFQSSLRAESQFDEDEIRHPSALPGLNRPMAPPRTASQTSASSITSYSSDAPLVFAARDMGYGGNGGRSYSPALSSTTPSQHNHLLDKQGLSRLQTQSSQASHDPYDTPWSGPTLISANQITPNSHIGMSSERSDSPLRMVPVASRSATPAAFLQQADGRKVIPRSVPERYEYEMQPQTVGILPRNPTSSGYIAYNSAIHDRQNTAKRMYPPRSNTAPPQQYSNPHSGPTPHDYFYQEALQPPRLGTAPVGDRKVQTSAAWASQKGVMDQF